MGGRALVGRGLLAAHLLVGLPTLFPRALAFNSPSPQREGESLAAIWFCGPPGKQPRRESARALGALRLDAALDCVSRCRAQPAPRHPKGKAVSSHRTPRRGRANFAICSSARNPSGRPAVLSRSSPKGRWLMWVFSFWFQCFVRVRNTSPFTSSSHCAIIAPARWQLTAAGWLALAASLVPSTLTVPTRVSWS